jgi:hypothetical protein
VNDRRAASRLVGPWLLLVAGSTAAVVLVCLGQLRQGADVLAGTLVVTAVLRAVLPARLAGAVAVRSRFVDVLLLGGAAVAAIVLAATLKIP